MRQFKQLGWIPQALLSLVLLSAMSQSHAMSVRERYLQEHPAAKVESSPEKISTHHKKHHVSEKHVVKTSEHHAEKVASKKHTHHSAVKAHAKVEHAKVEHAKVEHAKVEHVKHHAGQHSIKKEVVESKAKSPSNRVNIPKLAPTKFDSQQARAAEEALQHQPVKKEVQAESVPTKRHHEVAPVVKQNRHEAKHHHAAKPVREHHHKRHHAE